MMFEYVLIAYQYGAESANSRIAGQGWKVVIFLSFMTAVLAKIKIIPGRWKKYKFVMPTGLGSYFNFFSPPGTEKEIEEESYLGLHLKLFVKKSNRYVADKFPVSGQCIENLTLSGHDGWYLFQLNNPINYAGFEEDLVIVRVKSKTEKLYDDKVEIILLFIPVGTHFATSLLKVEDFRFTGAAFARPV